MAVQCSIGGTYLSSYPGNNMPGTTGTVTIMGWINYNSWNTTSTASMFGAYNGTANASTAPTTAIQIGATATVGQLHAWTWGGTTLVNTTAGSPTLTNNNWYHIAYTCTALSGTQVHSLYVNGVLAASATNSVQIAGTLTQMYINDYPQAGGGTNETNGVIVDNVALYNRMLSANEIQTVYTCRGLRDNITFGLVERHSFTEALSGNVTACRDYSNNSNELNIGAGTALTYTTGICFNNKRSPF